MKTKVERRKCQTCGKEDEFQMDPAIYGQPYFSCWCELTVHHALTKGIDRFDFCSLKCLKAYLNGGGNGK